MLQNAVQIYPKIINTGKVSVLFLPALSAAFDTVDHNILIERLEHLIGLLNVVLAWFRSLLQDRDYFVSVGSYTSNHQ